MILYDDLKRVKIISEPLDIRKQMLMIDYVQCLSEKSKTPELRAQWTMILKSLLKQTIRR